MGEQDVFFREGRAAGRAARRGQWKGVVDFAKAVNAEIVTSFATWVGARDSAGVWTSEQATRLIDYARALGGRVAAAEFMNEPNLAAMVRQPWEYAAMISRVRCRCYLRVPFIHGANP
jgi:sugar phosphate isomerase/epimerase